MLPAVLVLCVLLVAGRAGVRARGGVSEATCFIGGEPGRIQYDPRDGTVVRADPQIEVDALLIRASARPGGYRGRAGWFTADDTGPGSAVRFRFSDRTLVYRIIGPVPGDPGLIAMEWPD